MGFQTLTLLLLAASAVTRSGLAATPGGNDKKGKFLFYDCASNSDCSAGASCVEVLTEAARVLTGTNQCPALSVCVCVEDLDKASVASTIRGALKISVSNAAQFVNDPKAKRAMVKAVAKLTGVPVHYVTVTLALVTAGRRLEEWPDGGGVRQLQGSGSVSVSYTIDVPPDEPGGVEAAVAQVEENLAAASADSSVTTGVLMEAVQEELPGDAYTVSLQEVSAPTEETHTTTTTAGPSNESPTTTTELRSANIDGSPLQSSLAAAVIVIALSHFVAQVS